MTQAITPLDTSDSIKARLESLSNEEMRELETLYQQKIGKSGLYSTGWLNIGMGGLMVWIGLSNIDIGSPLPFWQAVFGAVIIAQSISSIASPSNAAILRFAAVFLISGMWNLGIALTANFVGFTSFVGLLGVMQLWWSYQWYREYQRYQKVSQTTPRNDLEQFYQMVIEAIATGSLKDDAASIDLWINRIRWRGLLLTDKAVFVLKGRNLLVVKSKADTNFLPAYANPLKKKQVYGRIALNQILEYAMMKHESFKKYFQWKGEESVLTQISPTLMQRLSPLFRIILIMLALFVAYLVIMTILGLGFAASYR